MDQVEYLVPDIINGLNLYAYCLNNPVMGYDPNGTFWPALIVLGTMVVGLLVTLTADSKEKPKKQYNYVDSNGQIIDGAINYSISQNNGFEPVIKIYDSYKITSENDKREILEYIIGTPKGQQYGLSADNINYYVNEWNVHNLAYLRPSLAQRFIDGTTEEIQARAKDVDLNTDDDNAKKYNKFGWLCGFFG